MKPIIISVAGPSGAGKSSFANRLKEQHGFKEIVSVTTRAPREGEIDGVHYFYVSKETFLDMEKNNELIEKTEVNGNYYGVPASEPLRIANEGFPIVVVAEPHGVEQVQEYCRKNDWISLEVFINSPIEVLMDRLFTRKQEEISRLNKEDPEYQQKFDKITNASTSRIKHIREVELEKWVKPAYSEKSIFPLVFDSFNAENEKEVIAKTMKYLSDIIKKEDLTYSEIKDEVQPETPLKKEDKKQSKTFRF